MVSSLQAKGYSAIGASDVREGMFKIKNQCYVCILLDIRLGANSGDDLVEFIRDRKDSLNTSTPIVIVSGYLDQHVVEKIGKNIQGALVKPFEMAALLDIVKRFA